MNAPNHRIDELRIWLLILLLSTLVIGCGQRSTLSTDQSAVDREPAAGTITLTIFAAASLTDAFREVGERFSVAHPNIKVSFNFAGSNQLAAQISEGAPADLFASANIAQMRSVIESGRIMLGAEQIFARNRLVVITPGDNPASLTTLQDLARPGIKIIFAAQAVPVGQYSLDFLDKANASGLLGADYTGAVMANVLSYEANVRAVLTKVTLGEADAGIVYTSDLATSEERALQRIEIPEALNTVAAYPIAVLTDSPHQPATAQFITYLLSPDGEQILEKYGFMAGQ